MASTYWSTRIPFFFFNGVVFFFFVIQP